MLRAVLALRLTEPKIQNLCEEPETFGFFGFIPELFGFPTEIQKTQGVFVFQQKSKNTQGFFAF